MDQGVAAIWAAGIGVGGVVITAGMGWYAAHKAAAAQVEAALAGARAQFAGQRLESMWQVRREAYTAFLGQVEAARVEVVELANLCDEAIALMEGEAGASLDLETPRQQLAQTFRGLWLRDSALRLSVDVEQAEQVERLRLLVMEAVAAVAALVDEMSARASVEAARGRSHDAINALHEGIVEWTRGAREHLNSARQVPHL
ncbi:hypothetical protein [Streptomyces lavendulocolor]|uniref:hypothetical protein n=1 Tax=Streptomyces lavendulocolor TaxID=67316 RepID=UPI003C2D801F